MSTTFEAPTVGIGRLLREGTRLFVPPHQRDYSWTPDEIEQLIDDIREAQSLGQTEYFIGLMVFMPRAEGELTILDGQQRLATTVLLLAAVRAWLREGGLDEDAGQIQSDFIAVRELGSDEHEARVVLNEVNNPNFEKYAINAAPVKTVQKHLDGLRRYDPNRKLLEAILHSRQRIEALASASADPQRALFDFVRYLTERVKVVRLTVQSEANAYTVFETLNDRGLDLSVLDLIKNHVFGKAGGTARLQEVQSRWTQMMASLAGVRADDFLKAWWTSRNGRVQTAQLFPKFKESIETWTQVRKTTEDMTATSEQYAGLEVADDPVWSDVTTEAKEGIRALKLLGSRQVHPVLLSGLASFPPRELSRLIRLLEVLIVRYQFIGGGRTGRLEIACASLAHQIHDGRIKTAAQARKALGSILPNDEDFKTSFSLKQEKNNQKVFYLLTRLEQQARRDTQPEGEELAPSGKLTVEHIFPRKPGASWKTVMDSDPALADECTYRLGNLCLLSSVNRSLGNKGFAEKRKTYGKSTLELTTEVARSAEWDRKSVAKRQKRLAKFAAGAWRFD